MILQQTAEGLAHALAADDGIPAEQPYAYGTDDSRRNRKRQAVTKGSEANRQGDKKADDIFNNNNIKAMVSEECIEGVFLGSVEGHGKGEPEKANNKVDHNKPSQQFCQISHQNFVNSAQRRKVLLHNRQEKEQ